MSKSVEMRWDVLLDDDAWSEEDRAVAPVAVVTQTRLGKGLVLVLFSLLGVISLWLWMGGPFAPSQAEAEVAETISRNAHLPNMAVRSDTVSTPTLRTADLAKRQALSAGQITLVRSRFLGNQAMVELRVTDASRPLPWREVRFYEQSAAGWEEIEPVALFWGGERRIRSEFFDFRFRSRDALAVQDAASRLDTQYRDLRQVFGLPALSIPAKIRVEISVENDAYWTSDRTQRRIRLLSPGLLTIPEGLTDGDVLVQSALFALTEWAIDEAQRARALDGSRQMSGSMRAGLRTWGFGQIGAPLSVRQRELRQAVFAANRDPIEALADMCQFLGVWTDSELGVPYTPLARDFSNAGWALALVSQLPPPFESYTGGSQDAPFDPSGSSIVLASLLTYAGETYGQGRIPLLLGGKATFASWETLIPVVFDVSAAEFEEGWQAWLAEKYEVDIRVSDQ